jgi:hypothetical protein
MQIAHGLATIAQERATSMTPEVRPIGAGYVEVWKPKIEKETEADAR